MVGRIKNKPKVIECENSSGNGAGLYICNFTNKTCPHQRWCTIKQLYEIKDTAYSQCSNFKKR